MQYNNQRIAVESAAARLLQVSLGLSRVTALATPQPTMPRPGAQTGLPTPASFPCRLVSVDHDCRRPLRGAGVLRELSEQQQRRQQLGSGINREPVAAEGEGAGGPGFFLRNAIWATDDHLVCWISPSAPQPANQGNGGGGDANDSREPATRGAPPTTAADEGDRIVILDRVTAEDALTAHQQAALIQLALRPRPASNDRFTDVGAAKAAAAAQAQVPVLVCRFNPTEALVAVDFFCSPLTVVAAQTSGVAVFWQWDASSRIWVFAATFDLVAALSPRLPTPRHRATLIGMTAAGEGIAGTAAAHGARATEAKHLFWKVVVHDSSAARNATAAARSIPTRTWLVCSSVQLRADPGNQRQRDSDRASYTHPNAPRKAASSPPPPRVQLAPPAVIHTASTAAGAASSSYDLLVVGGGHPPLQQRQHQHYQQQQHVSTTALSDDYTGPVVFICPIAKSRAADSRERVIVSGGLRAWSARDRCFIGRMHRDTVRGAAASDEEEEEDDDDDDNNNDDADAGDNGRTARDGDEPLWRGLCMWAQCPSTGAVVVLHLASLHVDLLSVRAAQRSLCRELSVVAKRACTLQLPHALLNGHSSDRRGTTVRSLRFAGDVLFLLLGGGVRRGQLADEAGETVEAAAATAAAEAAVVVDLHSGVCLCRVDLGSFPTPVRLWTALRAVGEAAAQEPTNGFCFSGPPPPQLGVSDSSGCVQKLVLGPSAARVDSLLEHVDRAIAHAAVAPIYASRSSPSSSSGSLDRAQSVLVSATAPTSQQGALVAAVVLSPQRLRVLVTILRRCSDLLRTSHCKSQAARERQRRHLESSRLALGCLTDRTPAAWLTSSGTVADRNIGATGNHNNDDNLHLHAAAPAAARARLAAVAMLSLAGIPTSAGRRAMQQAASLVPLRLHLQRRRAREPLAAHDMPGARAGRGGSSEGATQQQQQSASAGGGVVAGAATAPAALSTLEHAAASLGPAGLRSETVANLTPLAASLQCYMDAFVDRFGGSIVEGIDSAADAGGELHKGNHDNALEFDLAGPAAGGGGSTADDIMGGDGGGVCIYGLRFPPEREAEGLLLVRLLALWQLLRAPAANSNLQQGGSTATAAAAAATEAGTTAAADITSSSSTSTFDGLHRLARKLLLSEGAPEAAAGGAHTHSAEVREVAALSSLLEQVHVDDSTGTEGSVDPTAMRRRARLHAVCTVLFSLSPATFGDSVLAAAAAAAQRAGPSRQILVRMVRGIIGPVLPVSSAAVSRAHVACHVRLAEAAGHFDQALSSVLAHGNGGSGGDDDDGGERAADNIIAATASAGAGDHHHLARAAVAERRWAAGLAFVRQLLLQQQRHTQQQQRHRGGGGSHGNASDSTSKSVNASSALNSSSGGASEGINVAALLRLLLAHALRADNNNAADNARAAIAVASRAGRGRGRNAVEGSSGESLSPVATQRLNEIWPLFPASWRLSNALQIVDDVLRSCPRDRRPALPVRLLLPLMQRLQP